MLKTGGHSPWSTMRKDGMAKGLGTLKVISVDRETMSVTVQGLDQRCTRKTRRGRSMSLLVPPFSNLEAES
jgi:hypothetical protein